MATRILVIGAGRSSSSLIRYLIDNASAEDWFIAIGDSNETLAKERAGGNERAEGFAFDALNDERRGKEIERADFVVSMLPARFHILVAKDCIRLKKNVITPSYVTPEMKLLDQEARAAGIIIMNEIGVDPGIDHMSAMEVIHKVQAAGGKMLRFESFTGGLIAPESDDNPWNYKFTWNPRNVVLAGQGSAAQFLQEGAFKYIPYHRLFQRVKPIEIDGVGQFEGYANRDSLKYRSIYGLEDIPTIYRGTLRKAGYSKAWDTFVQLGMTDDSYVMQNSETMTNRDFVNSFLIYAEDRRVEDKIREQFDLSDDVMRKLEFLDLFEPIPVALKNATPAQILQKILETKLELKDGDKDMIVMWHRFNYEVDGQERELHSQLIVIGEDEDYTAMAQTVGLPVAICAKMIINGKIDLKGVQLPTIPEVYKPVMAELEEYGIHFKETEVK